MSERVSEETLRTLIDVAAGWEDLQVRVPVVGRIAAELLEARERIEMLEADAQLVLGALKYCRGIDGHDLEKMIDTYREECT